MATFTCWRRHVMILAITLAAMVTFPKMAAASLVLSEHIMKLTAEAAKLSMLAYEETEPDDTITHDYTGTTANSIVHCNRIVIHFLGGGYISKRRNASKLHFFLSSLCYSLWILRCRTRPGLKVGTQDICINIAGTTECCTSRLGFYEAYNTIYRKDVEDQVRQCASSCKDKDDCVVITGHSQGGAIAAVAAVFLAELNPYVITFGQPPTLDAPCDLLTTERIYRYVNTKQTSLGIAYDPVPMAPGLGADHFGNMIVLGDDPTGVAFIGLDAQDFLQPYLNGIEAHYMTGNGTYPGYADRIIALTVPNATYPIRNNVRYEKEQ
jgi:Lipase (class 3)